MTSLVTLLLQTHLSLWPSFFTLHFSYQCLLVLSLINSDYESQLSESPILASNFSQMSINFQNYTFFTFWVIFTFPCPLGFAKQLRYFTRLIPGAPQWPGKDLVLVLVCTSYYLAPLPMIHVYVLRGHVTLNFWDTSVAPPLIFSPSLDSDLFSQPPLFLILSPPFLPKFHLHPLIFHPPPTSPTSLGVPRLSPRAILTTQGRPPFSNHCFALCTYICYI